MGVIAAVAAPRFGETPQALTRARLTGQVHAAIGEALRTSHASGSPRRVKFESFAHEDAAIRFVPTADSDGSVDLIVYPDGSTNGGRVYIGERPILDVDWLTGETTNATS
jgi:type II secretory pathway pseudopilin PulG